MTTKIPPRRGRKRWGDLCAFLTRTMKESGSERTRMQAAMRLADILTLREAREQLELRRELRDAGKAVDAPATDGQLERSPDATERPESVEQFLVRIAARHTQETELPNE